jgi:hypothetical protein
MAGHSTLALDSSVSGGADRSRHSGSVKSARFGYIRRRTESWAEAVVPFKIQVPDAAIRDLKHRLSESRFADELDSAGWDYGTNAAYLKSLIAYWRTNTIGAPRSAGSISSTSSRPPLTVSIFILFISDRGIRCGPAAVLLNGWPSSIVDVREGHRTADRSGRTWRKPGDAFTSLCRRRQATGFREAARARLPTRSGRADVGGTDGAVGYTRCAVHGSDWGWVVGHRLAVNDAAHVFALH